jgi:dihydrodipicolinate synthase/N-acetylneuraminate lyase
LWRQTAATRPTSVGKRPGERRDDVETPPFGPDDITVVAPTPLPWTDDERLDRDALARNIERWARTDLSGFVVGSGGGEETYISEDELMEAVAVVHQARPAGKLLIGGVDNPSSTETIRRIHRFAEGGADLVRVRIPQTPLGGSRGGEIEYFSRVAEESPLPIAVIHQTWQTGGFAASPEDIGEICSIDAVIAYIGWHNVRYESYVRRFVPPSVAFWSPNGSLTLPYALIGATGVCCFFADWAPELITEIATLGAAGRFEEARPLQERVLWADFLGMKHGVAALKAGLTLLGYEGSVPRSPVRPLGAAETSELRSAFVAAGLLT